MSDIEISKKMAEIAIDALEDRKGEDIRVIDISEISTLADYFIIAAGTNRNQVQALADNVQEKLGRAGYMSKNVEGYDSANWILIDFGDIIVHVFDSENRLFYDLERIWRDGKLIEHQYEIFHALIDEETPVWKKDIAEMKKLFLEDDPENKYVDLTKWAHCYLDYDNEWIWLRDEKEENGAMFIRKDGKFKYIAAETPKLKFSRASKGNTYYLLLSGSAGGPATYLQVLAFENGKQTERFNALSIYGEIDECHLNGKTLSKELGQTYIDKLPESREINAYFTDIEHKNE